MVKIRLTKTGRKNHATFRVAITEARTKRETKAIELVGYYLPHEKKSDLNADRIKYWLSVGAQPSPTVQRLLVKAGLMEKPKTTVIFNTKPGKKLTERRAKKAEKAEAAKKAAEAPAPEPVAVEETAPAEATEETTEANA